MEEFLSVLGARKMGLGASTKDENNMSPGFNINLSSLPYPRSLIPPNQLRQEKESKKHAMTVVKRGRNVVKEIPALGA